MNNNKRFLTRLECYTRPGCSRKALAEAAHRDHFPPWASECSERDPMPHPYPNVADSSKFGNEFQRERGYMSPSADKAAGLQRLSWKPRAGLRDSIRHLLSFKRVRIHSHKLTTLCCFACWPCSLRLCTFLCSEMSLSGPKPYCGALQA